MIFPQLLDCGGFFPTQSQQKWSLPCLQTKFTESYRPKSVIQTGILFVTLDEAPTVTSVSQRGNVCIIRLLLLFLCHCFVWYTAVLLENNLFQNKKMVRCFCTSTDTISPSVTLLQVCFQAHLPRTTDVWVLTSFFTLRSAPASISILIISLLSCRTAKCSGYSPSCQP